MLLPATVLVDPAHPPPTLPDSLPVAEVAADSPWWRIHRTTHQPVWFGPAPGHPPTYRFDAPGGEFRVLYLGQTLSAAFVETLLRNPRVPFLDREEIELRSVSVLHNLHALRLVDLRGAGLSRIGADSQLFSGSYDTAARWALALWRHRDRPEGLLYRSRHDPNHICAAVFDRQDVQFGVRSTRPLSAIPHHWASILAVHGKGLA